MKEKMQYIKEKTWIHYLFITIVGILVCIPFLWMQIKNTHDGFIHLIRIIGLDVSISNGDFPFLIFPHICRDFGYSMTAFYPPLVTYIPYICAILSGVFANGLKIFATLTMIFSGIFMYNFVREVTKNKGISLISAIVYMVFPYRFEEFYTRFAIGEFTSFIFIPIVFQGLYNLLEGDKKKHFYIAIGAIGLLLSHTISTVFTALFCIIYILFNANKFFKKDVIKKCLINVLFILLISAFFVIPMLEFKMSAEYSIFVPDVMETSGKYTQWKVIEPWQLLKDKGEKNGVSFVIGVPMVFMLVITLLVYQEIKKKHKDFYIVIWILGIISTFMCFKYFPWRYMPNIFNTIQFPWRMLEFSIFFLAPVCGINVYYLIQAVKKESVRNILYIVFFIVLGIFTVMRLNIYQTTDKTIDEEYEGSLKESLVISHFSLNRDYLPFSALKVQRTYLNERENRIYILEGTATISNEIKDALNYECDLELAEKDAVLELPYIFYPGYTVILQNGDESINLDTFESNNGFVSVKIPKSIENGKIIVNYMGTMVEKISYAISAVSLVGFIVYIIYFRKKNREVRIGETNERKN